MALPVGQSLHLPRRGDGTLWTPDRALPSALPYDLTLGGIRVSPIPYNWPAPPNLTGEEVQVSSLAQLSSNLAPGRKVTLAPGTYTGNVSCNVNDVELVLTGCTINGNPSLNAQRVKWTGGRFVYTFEPSWWGQDVLLENVYFITVPGNPYMQHVMYSGIRRYAFVRCSLISTDSGTGALYCYNNTQDCIWAQCDIQAPTRWGLRIMGCDRAVVADCRFEVTEPNANLRFHAHNQDVNGFWCVGNQWDNGARCEVNAWGADGTTAGTITNAYVDDNRFYGDQAASNLNINQNGNGGFATVYARNNIHYTNQGTGAMQVNIGPGGTLAESTNNVRAPYVSPPAWVGGSDQ